MATETSQVRFSLKAKLLVSTIAALLLLIIFLNLSSIVLFKEDKRAYIYSAQATESALAGKELLQLVKHTLDTLKVATGTIDPAKPISAQQKASIQALLDNQSDVNFLQLALLSQKEDKLTPLVQLSKGGSEAHFELSNQDIPGLKSELELQSYSLINFSKVDSYPAIGVVLSDPNSKTSQGFVVALGVLSLKDNDFLSAVPNKNLTISTLNGRVLYDSDPAMLYVKKQVSSDPLFQFATSNKVSTGATEFEKDGIRYLGTYLRPGLDLTVLSRTEWKEAMRATYILGEKFILLGLMAISAAVIYALLFAGTLTTPLQLLFQGTKEIQKGNFDLNLAITSQDEIGVLTGSFNSMSKKISELMEEFRKKVLLEQEVAIASTVQHTLIPKPTFTSEHYHIRSHYQSANDCGGDWWGMFQTRDKLCLMISDATGHGLPSALITAAARGYFSVMTKLAEEDPDFSFSTSAMMAFANQVVYEASLGGIQMTFLIAVIDLSTLTMTYSSAGHTPPWLFTRNGDRYTQKSLLANGTRLGEKKDLLVTDEKTVTLNAGDILFLYTDGILEGTDKGGTMYGKKRLKKSIDETISQGPDAMIENVMKEFLAYNEGKSLDDDVTMVAVKFLKPYSKPQGNGQQNG
jgi:sigma-B regulation protein RsbU (phosphoserine phosphatase)